MLRGPVEERIDAHAEQEDKNVAEEDGERMPHEQVIETASSPGIVELFPGHNGKGPDVRAVGPGIVVVMMIVGAAPDGARAENQQAKAAHEDLVHTGARQNRVMLL